MTDTNLLKSVLMKNGITSEQLADRIGVSRATMSYKMNNKRDFTSQEIKAIVRILALEVEEMNAIFFADNVAVRIQP